MAVTHQDLADESAQAKHCLLVQKQKPWGGLPYFPDEVASLCCTYVLLVTPWYMLRATDGPPCKLINLLFFSKGANTEVEAFSL